MLFLATRPREPWLSGSGESGSAGRSLAGVASQQGLPVHAASHRTHREGRSVRGQPAAHHSHANSASHSVPRQLLAPASTDELEAEVMASGSPSEWRAVHKLASTAAAARIVSHNAGIHPAAAAAAATDAADAADAADEADATDAAL